MKMKKWKHIDRTKMLCFIGMLITIEIVKKPRIRDYCETSSLTGTSGIAEVMTR
jgi:hypothetical protein